MEKMYFLTEMKFEISIPVGAKEPIKLTESITQLAFASNKYEARKAVEDDLRKQYPEARIHHCRINDTIIGE